jgi:glutamate carboxypeptidase
MSNFVYVPLCPLGVCGYNFSMTPLTLSDFTPLTGEMVALLQRFAEIESPTTSKAAVDRFGAAVAEELRPLGAGLTLYPQAAAGDALLAKFNPLPDLQSGDQRPLLTLAHLDTVHELGTLGRFPVRVEGESLHGPGVFDMKGGIVALIFALRRLREISGGALPLRRPLWALFTSDEETGSETSRPLIESLARQAAGVFTLEPAMSGGELKTSRKGTGEIVITARGRAAHAGSDHAKGRNAIQELAHHILAVQKLTDYGRGTTVNVGVVHAGTRTNIVPDEARAEADFRVSDAAEVARLQAWAAKLRPVIEGCTVEAQVSTNRPPMPRDAVMALSFQKARAIGRKLGLELGEGGTGGASDANFVAPLGVPVLDGLGVRGDGAHSEREHTIIASLPERAALLAALLMEW